MRICQVLDARSQVALTESRTWYRNLHEPLIEMGHDVLLISSAQGWQAMSKCSSALRAAFSQTVLETFRREHVHKPFGLFFSYVMDGMIEPSVIDEIRRSGVPTCNFSCNNTHQFDLVDELSPHFDYNLHAEKDAASKFRSIGAKAVWFPMAANPRYYHPYETLPVLDVSFVGQCYARRPYYIWHLLENGINVQVFGQGWRHKDEKLMFRRTLRWIRRAFLLMRALTGPSSRVRHAYSARVADLDQREQLLDTYPSHLHPPIADDEMISTYSKSKISLGFLEVYSNHDPAALVRQHLHLREFEAPMSGALYLTGWCKELADFYDPDSQVLTYRSEHEMLDKIRYYLSHPEDAERVRQAGHQRAMRDHTYHRRFQVLFGQLGLVK